MPARKTPLPTNAELEILRVLWDRGSGSVRDVHEVLAPGKRTSYNTTLKLMQIMHEKGIVTRDDSRRPQVFRPAVPEAGMQRRLIADLLGKAFGGSARKLVAALTATNISIAEIEAIRELLDQQAKGKS